MKDTLVRGSGIVNPHLRCSCNKANAFPLLLDISGYVTSSGLGLPIPSDAVDCVTLGSHIGEDGQGNSERFQL